MIYQTLHSSKHTRLAACASLTSAHLRTEGARGGSGALRRTETVHERRLATRGDKWPHYMDGDVP